MPPRGCGNLAPRLNHAWIRHPARHAESLAEVSGSKEQHVDPREPCDCLHVIEHLRVLDLHRNQSLLVALRDVAIERDATIRTVRVPTIERPATHGMKTG